VLPGRRRPCWRSRSGWRGGRLRVQNCHNRQDLMLAKLRPDQRLDRGAGCWLPWCGARHPRCGRRCSGRGCAAATRPAPDAATGVAVSSAWPTWPPSPSREPSRSPAASSIQILGQVPSPLPATQPAVAGLPGPNRVGTSRNGRPVCRFHRMPPRPGGGRAMAYPGGCRWAAAVARGEGLVGELEHRACWWARGCPRARRYRPAPSSRATCGCSTGVPGRAQAASLTHEAGSACIG
jgi:hypothetical protein